jgi:hypothetical protein
MAGVDHHAVMAKVLIAINAVHLPFEHRLVKCPPFSAILILR